MKARLTKDFILEAAQFLPKAPEGHKCRQMHGHTFTIEISVEGEVDPATGWIYDHARISAAMKPIIELLDHALLNDIPGLENPTIELMAVSCQSAYLYWEINSARLFKTQPFDHNLGDFVGLRGDFPRLVFDRQINLFVWTSQI